MRKGSRTVLFWGAGATASLGIHTTKSQGDFLRSLAPRAGGEQTLGCRVRTALGNDVPDRWIAALCDLLKILGDREETTDDTISATDIHDEQLEAMRRNWTCTGTDALRKRIVEMRNLYDWPALVATINVCPEGGSHDKDADAPEPGPAFELLHLFNVLDMHQQSGHGFPDRRDTFLSPQRVIGARGALVLLIQALSYVDWHARARTRSDLQHHLDFAIELGRRMQREGLLLAADTGEDDFELDDFIIGDVSVVSMNWDPIGVWAQFVANRTLNRASNVPHIGSPARRMQLYHELGYFVAGPRVDKKHAGNKVWQPMNISSARQLNDQTHGANLRIRVSKYLFPHGCLWWRECPNCGKLSSYIGDEWAMDAASLLPPPPLRAFVQDDQFESWIEADKEVHWDVGEVDARACVHCKTPTYSHHTPVVMQTSFKTEPPPFLEEIQREMRVVVQEANHIVLAGYSLPPDDVTYRAFLAARIRKTPLEQPGHADDPVRCSVIDKADGYESRWLYPDELEGKGNLPDAVKHARNVFKADNVRFFGDGIPNVFLDGGSTVSSNAVERLLTWEER